MNERIRHICNEEGLQCGAEVLQTLGSVSAGDLRRAITTLQSAVRLAGPTGVTRCAGGGRRWHGCAPYWAAASAGAWQGSAGERADRGAGACGCGTRSQTLLDVAGQVPPVLITELLGVCKGQAFSAVQKKVRALAQHACARVAGCRRANLKHLGSCLVRRRWPT